MFAVVDLLSPKSTEALIFDCPVPVTDFTCGCARTGYGNRRVAQRDGFLILSTSGKLTASTTLPGSQLVSDSVAS